MSSRTGSRAPYRPKALLATLALVLTAACAGNQANPGSTQGMASQSPELLALYPLEAGWKWAYQVETENGTVLAVYEVVERAGDLATVRSGEERMYYQVSPLGIARRSALGDSEFQLKAPLVVGATWPVAGGTAKVAAIDADVTVRAGRFRGCVVIEETRSDPTRLVRTTFAPNVGPVDLEVRVDDAGKLLTATHATLLGVTRPGEDPIAE